MYYICKGSTLRDLWIEHFVDSHFKESTHIFGSRMCSIGMLHQWSLAVFLLCSPVSLYGRPVDALSNRMKRSVSHAQLMHDKGRSLQEFKRHMWLQKLLEEVHTADERAPPLQTRVNLSGGAPRQKPPGGTKNLPLRFRLDREGAVGANLPQETNKAVAYKDQPLKVATKRKKKVRLGRRRETEKKRRRARSVTTLESQRTQYPG